jgi:protein SCO1/2
MKNYIKAGLLIIILLVPAFVYLFLKSFGNNHYTLPKMVPIDVVERTNAGKLVYDTIYHQVPPFEFTSSEHKKFGSQNLKGKIYIADFFFTRCPSICPVMSTQLTRVQSALAEYKEVQLLSFTVDPENDTPEVLASFATKYKANPLVWHFLTGNKDTLYKVAKEGFKISALDDPLGGEEFVHSDKLILVDKNNIIRGFYDGTNPKEVDRLITEVKVLLHEYEQ